MAVETLPKTQRTIRNKTDAKAEKRSRQSSMLLKDQKLPEVAPKTTREQIEVILEGDQLVKLPK